MSLVRAFLGASASAVVAALWDVRDEGDASPPITSHTPVGRC
jgi:hypothetical protein